MTEREELRTGQENELPAQILVSGISQLSAGHAYETHTHPYFQLTHALQGTFQYVIAGQTFSVGPGDTVFIPSNAAHSIENIGEDEGYYFEVKFFFFSHMGELCASIPPVSQDDTLSRLLLSRLFQEASHRTALSGEVMLTYLRAVLFQLSASCRRQDGHSSRYIEIAPYPPRVRAVIRFLEEHHMKRLSLDDIVAALPQNKSYLCNLFKRETGVTIFECLMIIRVRRAAELLSYTEKTLTQICRETGFPNTAHFSRVFSKYVMIPPGQFRKYLKTQDSHRHEAASERSRGWASVAGFESRKIEFRNLLARKQQPRCV